MSPAGGSERLILNSLLLSCLHTDPYRCTCGKWAMVWLFLRHWILLWVSQGCPLLQPHYRHSPIHARPHAHSCRGDAVLVSPITNHKGASSTICDLVTEAVWCHYCSLFQRHQVHLRKCFCPGQKSALEVSPFITSTSCSLLCTVRWSQRAQHRFF